MQKIDAALSIQTVLPESANQGYTLEFFELSRQVATHAHAAHRQMLVMVEGSLEVIIGNDNAKTMTAGHVAVVEAGIPHAIMPDGTVRFFSIDFPLSYEAGSALGSSYYSARHEAAGYLAYSFFDGIAYDNKWSTALLEIHDSPRHYHKRERECFVVVEGTLDIEIDGARQLLQRGDFVMIFPPAVHKLNSATLDPVKVLCFNFPAFDIQDMRFV